LEEGPTVATTLLVDKMRLGRPRGRPLEILEGRPQKQQEMRQLQQFPRQSIRFCRRLQFKTARLLLL
jgi:hypothetical protein